MPEPPPRIGDPARSGIKEYADRARALDAAIAGFAALDRKVAAIAADSADIAEQGRTAVSTVIDNVNRSAAETPDSNADRHALDLLHDAFTAGSQILTQAITATGDTAGRADRLTAELRKLRSEFDEYRDKHRNPPAKSSERAKPEDAATAPEISITVGGPVAAPVVVPPPPSPVVVVPMPAPESVLPPRQSELPVWPSVAAPAAGSRPAPPVEPPAVVAPGSDQITPERGPSPWAAAQSAAEPPVALMRPTHEVARPPQESVAPELVSPQAVSEGAYADSLPDESDAPVTPWSTPAAPPEARWASGTEPQPQRSAQYAADLARGMSSGRALDEHAIQPRGNEGSSGRSATAMPSGVQQSTPTPWTSWTRVLPSGVGTPSTADGPSSPVGRPALDADSLAEEVFAPLFEPGPFTIGMVDISEVR
ncbi:hypothetical protein FEK35_08670 [Nocardia cyriacigeorgica]|uniref:Uncharacterized protein n=1 Tax=Nocardia cyriacigeorgica TaxID=135487 RepID=A0A5R8PGY8_9NOCA|nr:hypothetical protein [Nocardia cyriacigeorgica]TLG13851.1 hypothetical protein FEK35_08670 [Nocardia cyriacigeorgica]